MSCFLQFLETCNNQHWSTADYKSTGLDYCKKLIKGSEKSEQKALADGFSKMSHRFNSENGLADQTDIIYEQINDHFTRLSEIGTKQSKIFASVCELGMLLCTSSTYREFSSRYSNRWPRGLKLTSCFLGRSVQTCLKDYTRYNDRAKIRELADAQIADKAAIFEDMLCWHSLKRHFTCIKSLHDELEANLDQITLGNLGNLQNVVGLNADAGNAGGAGADLDEDDDENEEELVEEGDAA